MGRRKTAGIYPAGEDGWQINAQYKGQSIRRRGFKTASEAEEVLTAEKERIRRSAVLGQACKHTLEEAAIHYVTEESKRGKVSLETEIHLLKRVVAELGDIALERISQTTVEPFIEACQTDGLKNKTINNALGVIIRICTLAARSWRDKNGNPWLMVPPLIRKLSLQDQRPPRPISWAEQKTLLPLLPPHLAKMALFNLQTGARMNALCQLRWEWEISVPLDPETTVSVFIVPKEYVKGRKAARVLVCNSVAQAIIDGERGKHEDRVFTYRRERIKNIDKEPVMPYQPVDSMNNTAWQRGRRLALLGDLHVHDLRHTVGMRLREAEVKEATVSDILWHSRVGAAFGMTAHYSAAQVREVYAALEKIKTDANRTNVSLLSLVNGMSTKIPPAKKKRVSA